MRKRIMCKKKSGNKQNLNTTQKILFITAILNFVNAVLTLIDKITK